MAHRRSFHGNSEIVEIEEDEEQNDKGINYSRIDMRTEEKDRRSLPSNLGCTSSLEDELSQLFEMFNRRKSSQGTGYSPLNDTGSSKKHTSKKPMRASTSSSAHGISERVNLKQAFRGLCISQASEMAAVKRSARSSSASEAGRIMTLYRNVVVEDNPSVVRQDEGKEGLLEISLTPEESVPRSSFTQNARVLKSSESKNEVTELEALPRDRTLLLASSSTLGDVLNMSHSSRLQNGKKIPPTEPVGVQSLVETSQSQRLSSLSASSSPAASDNPPKTVKGSQKENGLAPISGEHVSCATLREPSQKDKYVPAPSASRSSDGRNSVEYCKLTAMQIETTPTSPMPGFKTSKNDMFQEEEHTHTTTSSNSDLHRNMSEPIKSSSTSYKPINEESAPKSAKTKDHGSAVNVTRKGNLQKIPSSGLSKGNKVKKSTRSVSRFVKPVVKTKNFVKRKTKKDMSSAHNPKVRHSEFNNALYPGPNNIVCPRCQCSLADEWEEVGEELLSPDASSRAELSPLSLVASHSAEVSPFSPVLSPCAGTNSGNAASDVGTPTYNMNSASKSKEAVKLGGKLKSRDKGEFTQSSKSSPEECSSSTSISEESNISRPSCCDRPHMSKDVRWQTIRQFRMQHGVVSLRHFNLLKKLGSGDIGTVYLAELIGTNCLFAIKVMDNEFLLRRKKIMRAQTEREILRMLDHPFLPTLYCQFTSDNLSCLVMEYCPGGDLHVLRQKQSGRCFTEQAARFYVAEVLLALEYLHMLGVIYRDLKPENILVREDGHIMLSDFDLSLRCDVSPTLVPSIAETTKSMSGPIKDSGCVQPFCIQQPSCRVSCFGPRMMQKPRKLKSEPADFLKSLPLLVAEPTSARSNSFVGTHEYLAPEIIKGEGHGSAVDWWTFGIFLFELLYGRTPFRGSGNEETLANVVLKSLRFPDSPLVSLQARDLINRLLVKEPESRLGTERGSAEIKQHPFFEGLNWALIRCAVPPELPEFHRSYGVGNGPLLENNLSSNSDNNGYSEFNASSGEQLEFEVF